MVSQRTRNVVWQSYLDVSRLGLYYETLANRYRRYYLLLRVALLFSVIGSVASPFMPLIHPAATFILVAATVILVAVDYALDFAKKSAVLHQINVQVGRLETEWKMLWIRVDDDDSADSNIRSRNLQLEERLMEVVRRCGEEGIATNYKLDRKCMEMAYDVIEEKTKHARQEQPE